MLGYYPHGATCLADDPLGPDNVLGRFVVSDLPDGPATYLVELGTAPPAVVADPPSWNMLGGSPLGCLPDAAGAAANAPTTVLRYSDRGWIGEPGDAQTPNVAYLPRVVSPPAIERSMRVLPEDAAHLTFQSGEVVLDNGDGALNAVGGDWTMAGRPAVIRRGPHRTPLRAPYAAFQRVAALRITSAAVGTTRLTVGMQDAGTSLKVPVSGTYAGTGGIEGDAGLTGQSKPLLYGLVRNIAPVKLLAAPAACVFQVSAGLLASVSAVRDRGSALTATGDYATLAALQGASLSLGQYATCLALGLVRTGVPPVGQLTCDATGPYGYSHGTAALALLRGPGGLGDDLYDAAAFVGTLPNGQCGFLFAGGTVEDALDRIILSCASWWGSDRLGRITGGLLPLPETAAPVAGLASWMLGGMPEEQPGTPPRWRQRVAYRALATVQGAADLAGMYQDNPAAAALYTTASQVAVSYSAAVQAAYPAAVDPEPLVTGFDGLVDAQALADALMARHGTRRRRWTVRTGRWGHLFDVGDPITVDHPRLAGRTWVCIAKSEAGDDVTATLWG